MLITPSRLTRDLTELTLRRGGVTMVHGRMSALGQVIGGAETVVRALLSALGPDATLLAYTGWQDAPPDDLDDLDAEAARRYRDEQPAYDPHVARARREHGRLAEALRTWPGAQHSGHPEAGVTAVGPLAAVLTASHPFDDAYGAGTPYARLVDLQGQVVLVGAPLGTVTLLHHAEAMARVPGKRRVRYELPVTLRGQRVWRTFSDIDTGDGALPYARVLGSEDYLEHLAQSALAVGAGRSGPLGEATGYAFDAQKLVAHAVAWLERTFTSDAP